MWMDIPNFEDYIINEKGDILVKNLKLYLKILFIEMVI